MFGCSINCVISYCFHIYSTASYELCENLITWIVWDIQVIKRNVNAFRNPGTERDFYFIQFLIYIMKNKTSFLGALTFELAEFEAFYWWCKHPFTSFHYPNLQTSCRALNIHEGSLQGIPSFYIYFFTELSNLLTTINHQLKCA